jgi:hydrogenase expression/formation protein HypD
MCLAVPALVIRVESDGRGTVRLGGAELEVSLARIPGLIQCAYGDTLRVPGSAGQSLLAAKAAGRDVRLVYSPAEVLRVAADNPGREVVFFAIGFETTAPATALLISQADAAGTPNLTVFCNHVLTPSAIAHLLQAPEIRGLPESPHRRRLGEGVA